MAGKQSGAMGGADLPASPVENRRNPPRQPKMKAKNVPKSQLKIKLAKKAKDKKGLSTLRQKGCQPLLPVGCDRNFLPKLTALSPEELKEAKVPPPDLARLTLALPSRPGRSKRTMQAKHQQTVEHKAERWFKSCRRFRIKGVYLRTLRERPKNTTELVEEAHQKMSLAKDSPADACSGMWYDEEGQLLVAVFSHRLGTDAKDPWELLPDPKLPYYSGPTGRTVADIAKARQLGSVQVHYDGLPPDTMRRYHEAIQYLHSKVHPTVHERDIRHDPNLSTIDLPLNLSGMDLNQELDPEEVLPCRPGVQYVPNEVGKERVGVTHLVHAWPMQGHKGGNLMPSKDFFRGSQAAMAVQWHFVATQDVARLLSAYFQRAYPEYHRKYSEAFAAGIWNTEDPGPWLGRALVYKLQVLPHVDGLDNGPTACFPVGYFSGGAMHLSDLGLKVQYGPGDIIIFLSGWLYHAVQFWQPAPPPSPTLSSGRIGSVFFFPDSSFERLEGKPARWNTDTLTGKFPAASA